MDKIRVHQELIHHIQLKIIELKKHISHIDEAVTLESKSSAGDKYETSREMLQQERDKKYQQLKLWDSHESTVKLMKVGNNRKVEHGALVRTRDKLLYISIAIGKIEYNDIEIIAISEAAPLFAVIKGFVPGDSYSYANQADAILEVY